jgi:integrase
MPLDLRQHDNGIWYVFGTVTIWRKGQPHSVEVRRSTRCRDEEQADGVKRQIENQVAEQNITGREPAITFRQAAALYVKQGGEERFLEKPKNRLGGLRVDEITQQIIDDAGQKAYPDSTSTRRRQFHAPVIAVLKAAGIERQFKRPADGQRRTIFFLPDQADATLKQIAASRWPNPWTPALFTFFFCQGSRVGETLAIDGKSDISLEHRYAILRDTKNGKERMLPLYPRTLAALSMIPNIGKRGPLFLRYDGRPYAEREDRGFRFRAWNSAVERVGLDSEMYTPHTARHSWATWFYAQTKDVVRLKAEGGWESSEWERYVKLAAPTMGRVALQYGFDFSEKPQNGGAEAHRNAV